MTKKKEDPGTEPPATTDTKLIDTIRILKRGTCPSLSGKCGSEMKIISFIDERLLICHILKHLNLWQERIPKGLPPPEDTTVETIVCEEFDDGWGSYNDPDVTMH